MVTSDAYIPVVMIHFYLYSRIFARRSYIWLRESYELRIEDYNSTELYKRQIFYAIFLAGRILFVMWINKENVNSVHYRFISNPYDQGVMKNEYSGKR